MRFIFTKLRQESGKVDTVKQYRLWPHDHHFRGNRGFASALCILFKRSTACVMLHYISSLSHISNAIKQFKLVNLFKEYCPIPYLHSLHVLGHLHTWLRQQEIAV